MLGGTICSSGASIYVGERGSSAGVGGQNIQLFNISVGGGCVEAGVVVFSGILLLLGAGHAASGEESIAEGIGMIFLEEAVGGLLFGGLIGFVGYYLIKSVKEFKAKLVLD